MKLDELKKKLAKTQMVKLPIQALELLAYHLDLEGLGLKEWWAVMIQLEKVPQLEESGTKVQCLVINLEERIRELQAKMQVLLI